MNGTPIAILENVCRDARWFEKSAARGADRVKAVHFLATTGQSSATVDFRVRYADDTVTVGLQTSASRAV
jgi:hypothetical protein